MGVRDDPLTMTCAINWYRANFSDNIYEKSKTKPTQIAQDVLILWGDKDIALMPDTPEYERQFISGELQIVHFKEGNHNLFHSHPNECYEHIIDYLNKRETGTRIKSLKWVFAITLLGGS